MPLERRHARIPAAIALVALAAFAILWAGARTPLARGMIAGVLGEAVGLPVTVASLRIGYFPSPHFDLRGLAIAQPAGFGDEPLIEVARVEVSLPWKRLIGATDRVDAVTISDVTARLRIAADGSDNWSKLFPVPETLEDTAAPDEPARWSIGALALEGGTVDYRDAAAGSGWQFTGITAKAGEVAPGAAFPFELQFGGLTGTQTIHFAAKGEVRLDLDAGRYAAHGLEFRGWLGGDPLPLAGAELTGTLREARHESDTGETRLAGGRFEFAEVPGRFDGILDFNEVALVVDLAIATDVFAPRASAIIFGHPLPATRDPAAFGSLQLTFRARMQDGEFALDPLSGRLDDTRFEGRVIPGRRFVRASLDAVDFNRYLPLDAKPAGTGAAAKKETLESLVAPLAKLDIDAEFRIGEGRIAGAKMRDAVLRVVPVSEGAP